ncbi:hypothetical protein B0A49_05361, partial [Cryomyces minteri]
MARSHELTPYLTLNPRHTSAAHRRTSSDEATPQASLTSLAFITASTTPQRSSTAFIRTKFWSQGSSLVILGTVSFGIPFYGVLLYSGLSQQSSGPSTRTVPQDVSDRYDKNARDFDSEVGTA